MNPEDKFDPPHQLVWPSPRATAGPPFAFVPAVGAGPVRREWTERETAVTDTLAALLDLPAGATMVERTLRLHVGEEPVLLSSSYLQPAVIRHDSDWQRTEVGQLALTTRPTEPTRAERRARMPTLAEAAALHIDHEEDPVFAIALPHRVDFDDDTTAPAGVLVVGRGDRVHCRLHEAPWSQPATTEPSPGGAR
jgi:DNA-binding GntR family transcriptional regulator